MSKSILDVVILTAGRFDTLAKTLESVYREAQDNPISVYIIDNFSPAEERIVHNHLFEYQPEKDPKHNIINWKTKRLQQNVGYPGGCNEGVREGKSPLIAIWTDDVVLQEGMLDKVIRRMDDLSIGTLGIKLLFPSDSTSAIRPASKVQHIGVALDIRGVPQHALVGWTADNPKCNISRDCWAVTGAFFVTRRNLWNKIGGFDLSYGKGTYEDMEYCMRTKQNGLRVFVDTEILGWHYVGATAEKRKESFALSMNQMIFASRWAQSGQMVWDEWLYW